MGEVIVCCNCDKECTSHYVMCDEQEGEWCPECFWEKTACGQGVHGEGCPTTVFSAPGGPDAEM